jgi:Trypsin
MATADEDPMARVVGGIDTYPGQYRFFTSWDGGCGASLIHEDMLLTAAHVSYSPDLYLLEDLRPSHLLFYSHSHRILN